MHKSLTKSFFVHFLQEGMQFYDTPRTLMQEQPESQGQFANYDTPQQPLPVYKKPCGCVMKLVKTGENFISYHVYFAQQVISSLDLVPP